MATLKIEKHVAKLEKMLEKVAEKQAAVRERFDPRYAKLDALKEQAELKIVAQIAEDESYFFVSRAAPDCIPASVKEAVNKAQESLQETETETE